MLGLHVTYSTNDKRERGKSVGVCWEEGARETARDVTNINHNFSLKCINDVVRNQRSTVETVSIVREGKVGLDR